MKRNTILLITLIFALVISAVSALGVGISPSSFTIEDALKGETFDQKLTVFNTADESCNYEFVVTEEISDWVSFYALDGKTPIDIIKVPGRSSGKIIARFSVPPETPNGIYTGMIYAQTIPKVAKDTTEEMGAVAQTVLRAPSEVTIVVGSGVLVEKETLTAETSTETPAVTETPTVTEAPAVTETPTPTTETDLATETPTVTEVPSVTETPTPRIEADLATETPTVTEAPAVTETPASETDLTTETPAGTEAETNTKVPGFGFIGALIATIVVFVIAKKSGKKGEK